MSIALEKYDIAYDTMEFKFNKADVLIYCEGGWPNGEIHLNGYEFKGDDDTLHGVFVSSGKFPDITFHSLKEIQLWAMNNYEEVRKAEEQYQQEEADTADYLERMYYAGRV